MRKQTIALASVTFFSAHALACFAQTAQSSDVALQDRIRELTQAVNRVEAQMEESRRELADLKHELEALRNSSGVAKAPAAETGDVAELAAAVASMRETQTMHDSQIATLEQTKVESASKYPVKLSGLILMTGFVNTRRVDAAPTPTVALAGSGSTGATLRQTILGLDATGPHVFGASSRGDMRIDMSAVASGSGYSGGYSVGLLRLRTAHAELNWDRTRAFFALDRPILSPEAPTSFTAVAEPALAWSGNLWAWNPQFGASADLVNVGSGAIRVKGSLINVADPPLLYPVAPSGTYTTPSTAELSRWPGAEARIAYESANEDTGARLGASGYFAPHRAAGGSITFDSWAGAADFRLPISRYTQLSGSAYRGAALGGLGAGAYKDYVARFVGGDLYYRALDDVGGWMQWKQKAGERLEFNEAYGLDDVPAHQLRPYASATPVSYYNLTRNRTITGNVIYTPSAYLVFSLEYRRIASSYVTSPTLSSDVIGIAAGYKF